MPTENSRRDSPWRRLPWTLPSALLLSIAALWSAAYFTTKADKRLPEPPAVEAQIVELPPPETSPPHMEHAAPHVEHPNVERAPIAPHEAQTQPQPQAQPQSPPQAQTLPQSPPQAPTQPAPPAQPAADSKGGMTGNSGPQAIVKPMPEIPDELRQDAFNAVAIVRFHVAKDGTATVELVQPTPHPRLNRLLLDTLKDWRFFPAIKDGQPVESVYPLTFRFEVP